MAMVTVWFASCEAVRMFVVIVFQSNHQRGLPGSVL